MRKQLKRRNKQKFTAIFKEGRTMFPKGEFTNLCFLGKCRGINLFAAKEGYSIGGMTFVEEATWR